MRNDAIACGLPVRRDVLQSMKIAGLGWGSLATRGLLKDMSPLRGDELLRCVSSRCQMPIVSSFGRPVLTRARCQPPRLLARRVSPNGGLRALPERSPMQRSRLRLHRDAEQPGRAGCAGGMTTAARSRARGLRALFPSRVRERGPLDELTGVPLTSLRSVRCTPARSSPRSPAMPDAGPLRVVQALSCPH